MRLTVKQARLFKGETQRQMALNLGLHVDTYRKIERNPDAATVGQAKKISEITGVPYNDIFFDKISTLSRDTNSDTRDNA